MKNEISFVIEDSVPIAIITIGVVELRCGYERGTYKLLLGKTPVEVLDVIEHHINEKIKDSYIKKGAFKKKEIDLKKLDELISTIKKFMHLEISKSIQNRYIKLLQIQGEQLK